MPPRVWGNVATEDYIPPVKTKIYKSTFVMRCTEEELEQLLNRLATENIKFREMYSACDFFLTDDSMYSVLHWTVADELGEERADELLEPEE